MRPDVLGFNRHVNNGDFQLAAQQGKWGIVNNDSERPTWPFTIIWVSASPRENSPEKYYFRFELTNYPSDPPDICIWNHETNTPLEAEFRPKGVEDAKMLFRTDWENGLHLYAPYERKGLSTHGNWPNEYPDMCWKAGDSIVKALENIHYTLNSKDYHGK